MYFLMSAVLNKHDFDIIASICLKNRTNQLQSLINTMQDVINVLKTFDPETNVEKNMKHNPFSLIREIKNVKIGEKQITVKYENGSQTILFNTCEKRIRSFSFETQKENHANLIITQLNCAINQRKLVIKNLERGLNICRYSDLREIVHKKGSNDRHVYYISVCPIYAFILNKGKTKIANQYELKFENGKYRLYYGNAHKFSFAMSRPHLFEPINKFNASEKTINSENFLHVIRNMENIGVDSEMTDETGLTTKWRLVDIDKPPEITYYRK
jgi:hypothetical protein